MIVRVEARGFRECRRTAPACSLAANRKERRAGEVSCYDDQYLLSSLCLRDAVGGGKLDRREHSGWSNSVYLVNQRNSNTQNCQHDNAW
jgi:hypothetical protein